MLLPITVPPGEQPGPGSSGPAAAHGSHRLAVYIASLATLHVVLALPACLPPVAPAHASESSAATLRGDRRSGGMSLILWPVPNPPPTLACLPRIPSPKAAALWPGLASSMCTCHGQSSLCLCV